MADLIEKNRCGIAECSGSPAKFAQKIIELKNNPKLIRVMRINSSELAHVNFNRADLAKKRAKFIIEE